MVEESGQNLEEVRENVYPCRQLGLNFDKPCTLSECIAHTSKYRRLGFPLKLDKTHCTYEDFKAMGHPEDLDFAAKEQGRVGYRDLAYIAPYFGVSDIVMRNVYEQQEVLLRNATLALTASHALQDTPHCSRCGFLGAFTCTDTSKCSKRLDAVTFVGEEYAPLMSEAIPIADFYAVLWKDASREKKLLPHHNYIPLLLFI